MSEHIAPLRVYFAVFAALIFLTGATVGVAFINVGVWNLPLALGIATLKAVLVILFFMHIWYSSGRLTTLVVMASIAWLLLLLGGALADYVTRGNITPPTAEISPTPEPQKAGSPED